MDVNKERSDFVAELNEREAAMEQLQQGFMKPVVYRGTYIEVETSDGTEIVTIPMVPDGVCFLRAGNFQEYCHGKIIDPEAQLEIESGYLARMSAPGYMDCTDWTAHKTQEAAEDYLIENYGEN